MMVVSAWDSKGSEEIARRCSCQGIIFRRPGWRWSADADRFQMRTAWMRRRTSPFRVNNWRHSPEPVNDISSSVVRWGRGGVMAPAFTNPAGAKAVLDDLGIVFTSVRQHHGAGLERL